MTTIYVTHDQIEAMTLADRVVVMNRGIVQQVGDAQGDLRPPREHVRGRVHRLPRDEPFVDGELANGVLTGPNLRIEGLTGPNGPVTLGFRAEDAMPTDGDGEITAPVYTVELLGDATMITVRLGDALVSVKAHKDFRVDIGQNVSVTVPTAICHLFDRTSGTRIQA